MSSALFPANHASISIRVEVRSDGKSPPTDTGFQAHSCIRIVLLEAITMMLRMFRILSLLGVQSANLGAYACDK
jgi:hypothetical protein